MGEAIAKVVGKPRSEDLRLVFQTSKCPGVNYAVAVAPKFVAIGVRELRKAAAAGALNGKAQPRERTFLSILQQISWTAREPRQPPGCYPRRQPQPG